MIVLAPQCIKQEGSTKMFDLVQCASYTITQANENPWDPLG